MRRNFVRLCNERPQRRGDAAKVAENFQPDVILLHLVDGLVQIFVKQGHDGAHLVRRAFPVLGGEGVDRQIVETEVFAVGCDPAKCLAARGVARRARQTALLRPAAIAVHDDGNVPRQRLRRVLFLKKCHKFVPFTAKAASGGFCGIVCGICTVQRPTNRRVIANQ